MIAALLSEFWPYIAATVGAIAALLGVYAKGRKDAAGKAAQRAAGDQLKQGAKGRDAVAKESDETDGMSSDDLVERMRERSQRWRM